MEVSPHDQPTRRQNVVIEAPKIFYGIKRVDSSQCLSPCRLFLASDIIPQVVQMVQALEMMYAYPLGLSNQRVQVCSSGCFRLKSGGV